MGKIMATVKKKPMSVMLAPSSRRYTGTWTMDMLMEASARPIPRRNSTLRPLRNGVLSVLVNA